MIHTNHKLPGFLFLTTLTATGTSDFFGAGAVSNDGSVIAGEHALPNKFDAFRWTAAHGMVRLPLNIASAITADGAMLAGGDNWWKTSGQTGIFGPFPGEQDQTSTFGLSGIAQAPVAVGAAIKGSNAFGPAFRAFRWTPAGGLQDLGVTTGTESFATAISADGLVIVGGGPRREWLLAGVSLERHHRHAGYRHSRWAGERRIRGQ
jgi:uncharacterized membrane protein